MVDCPRCGGTHAFHAECRWWDVPGGTALPPPAVAVGAPDLIEARGEADAARTAAGPRPNRPDDGFCPESTDDRHHFATFYRQTVCVNCGFSPAPWGGS